MAIEVRPATVFDDVATMVGPKRPDATVCWCLNYRIPSKESRLLRGPARGERVRALMGEGPTGVLAYDGDEVVGWAAVAPRADTTFARNRKIPHVDALDVWSVWCIRVRPGHRKSGISHDLLAGAVEFARANGAPVDAVDDVDDVEYAIEAAEPEPDWDPPAGLEEAISRFNAAQRVVYRTVRMEVGAGAANFIKSCCVDPDGSDRLAGAELLSDGSWDADSLKQAIFELRIDSPWEEYQGVIEREIDLLREHIGDARAHDLLQQVQEMDPRPQA